MDYKYCLFFTFVNLVVLASAFSKGSDRNCGPPIKANDKDRLQFALNLEYLEAEFFCYGSLGHGIDFIEPGLSHGGPPPIGAQKANLNPLVCKSMEEFCYQEIGHVRSIWRTVGGFPRPLYDLRAENFANFFDEALEMKLDPPFDPYATTSHYLLAAYLLPYVGLVGYVGTIPQLYNYTTKRLAASLLGVEAGQDAVIRTMLYEKAGEKVEPYDITVAEFTNALSRRRNELAMCGIKDEGVIVPKELGAENRTNSNILSADPNSLSYARTPPEILSIMHATGNYSQPGGFFPKGANGRIAKSLLFKFKG
ncbi:ferritin-like catalase Nec2 [Mercurialis annua]|uniref:ferritin-like catalase Nec2 n=1 Tax=Mercurialis annua TaxID=3986 RepID=UPI00216002E1|nr:ferritin-like catalase Nec2 [Mercurialis annua]